jgi:hypothetical protein
VLNPKMVLAPCPKLDFGYMVAQTLLPASKTSQRYVLYPNACSLMVFKRNMGVFEA